MVATAEAPQVLPIRRLGATARGVQHLVSRCRLVGADLSGRPARAAPDRHRGAAGAVHRVLDLEHGLALQAMRPVVEPLRHALVAAMRALHLRAVVPRTQALRLFPARRLRRRCRRRLLAGGCARLRRRGLLWARRRLGAGGARGARGRGLAREGLPAREGLLPHGLRLGAIAALAEPVQVHALGPLGALAPLALQGAARGELVGARLANLPPRGLVRRRARARARAHGAPAEHREALQARGLVVQPLRHARVAARGALHLHPLGRHVASTGRGVRQRHAGEEGATGQKAGECRTRGAQQAWPGPKWLGRRW
mmetsp:Transcript_104644/g.291366  ORF Transcript_104644/g.291366 Transcript_104644/m.291366 type:complete len:312 (-) Transcript_104644:1-936(-)